MLSWVTPKNVFIAFVALVLVALGTTVMIQHGMISMKNGELTSIRTANNDLKSANETFVKNQKEIRESLDALKTVTLNARPAKAYAESVKVCDNADIKKANDCLGEYYRTGVLPKDCIPDKADLSNTDKTGVDK